MSGARQPDGDDMHGDEIKPSVRGIRMTLFLFLGAAGIHRRARHPRVALLYPSFERLNLGTVKLYVGGGVETVLNTLPVQMPTAAHVGIGAKLG